MHSLSPGRFVQRAQDMLPSPPEGFVERPEEFDSLIQALTDTNVPEHTTAIRTALHGAQGVGKTMLALAACYSPQIQEHFPGGIFWFTLGVHPTRAELLAHLNRWRSHLAPDEDEFTELTDAAQRLFELMPRKRFLVVLDDAWEELPVDVFHELMYPQWKGYYLVTTQLDDLAESVGVQCIALDKMKEEEALRLLLGETPLDEFLRPALLQVARRLSFCPLLLGLAKGWLSRRLLHGQTLAGALDELLRDYERKGVVVFDHSDKAQREAVFAQAIELSLDQLSGDEARRRFHLLAAFPEDMLVPAAAVEVLWQLSESDTEALLTDLDNLALVRLDPNGKTLQLHDAVRDYLLHKASSPTELHRQLLDAYRQRASGAWHTLPEDGYIYWRLLWHLAEANLTEEVRALLFDAKWMQAKLKATGISALILDYDLLGDAACSRNQPPGLVRAALLLSAHVLGKDKEQLASQLLGRLLGFHAPEIRQLLSGLSQAIGATPRLLPHTPTLAHPASTLLCTLTGHEESVRAVAVLPGGKQAISASYDNTLKLWDLESGTLLRTMEGHEDSISAVALLPGGKQAISASWDNTLKLWDLESGEPVRTLEGHEEWVTTVAVLPGGKQAISGSEDKTLKLWDLESGTLLRTMEGHDNWVSTVAVLPGGKQAISGSGDSTLKLWDLESGALLRTMEVPGARVASVAVLPEGKQAISGSSEGTIELWDLESGALLRTIKAHESWVNALAVLPGGKEAISGSGDSTLKLWDLEKGRLLCTIEGHQDSVITVAVLPDGKQAISGSDDYTLRLWNLESDALLRSTEAHKKRVTSVAVLPGGKQGISGSMDSTLKLWDLESGRLLRTLEGHKEWVSAVAVLPGGKQAISGSGDSTLKLWDLESGALLRTMEDYDSKISAVAVLSGGKQVLSGSDDNTLKLWDLETGKLLRVIEGHEGSVSAIAVLPGGTKAVSGSSDYTLKLWDLEEGTLLRAMKGHKNWVNAVAVLSGGKQAISGSGDSTLKLWDLESGTLLRTLEGHEGAVSAVAVLAGEKQAISSSWDSTLKLWDLESGKCISTYSGDSGMISCAVSSNGRRLVAGDKSGQIHFLDLVDETQSCTASNL